MHNIADTSYVIYDTNTFLVEFKHQIPGVVSTRYTPGPWC